MATAGDKRDREEDLQGTEVEEVKKAKIEDAKEPDTVGAVMAEAAKPSAPPKQGTVAVPSTAQDTAEAAEQTDAAPSQADGANGNAAQTAAQSQGGRPGKGPQGDPPKKIGYITFSDGQDALDYFYKLTSLLRKNQDLNEYETTMALDLLKTGHPAAPRKLGPGVKAIQVRDVSEHDFSTACFHLIRPDGSAEDFSMRKCVAELFPNFGSGKMHPSANFGGRGGRGRGRGGARGGRQSGRGGRGRK
ncbi:hypothetical protein WJX73_010528 [Symbiochloris irregularis]|uniref:Uncharacterized protein n=1 Tax=Symbiochloris irregularis TaxID=706552 RepID=A0AAW1PJ34_9CHLO